MIVIADTTPLNYLVLIDYVGILPQLYGRVLIPQAVWQEFQRHRRQNPCEFGLGDVRRGSKFGRFREAPRQPSYA